MPVWWQACGFVGCVTSSLLFCYLCGSNLVVCITPVRRQACSSVVSVAIGLRFCITPVRRRVCSFKLRLRVVSICSLSYACAAVRTLQVTLLRFPSIVFASGVVTLFYRCLLVQVVQALSYSKFSW